MSKSEKQKQPGIFAMIAKISLGLRKFRNHREIFAILEKCENFARLAKCENFTRLAKCENFARLTKCENFARLAKFR